MLELFKQEAKIVVAWRISIIIITSCYSFVCRVDTIADRIDSGLQQALQPVVDAVDQLHSNLRETVNNLNRQQGILGAISGSKIWNGQFNIGGNNASPAKAPVPNSPSPSEGNVFHNYTWEITILFQYPQQ